MRVETSSKIKNLSIALDALGRSAPDLYDRVRDLLKDIIREEETYMPPPARPARLDPLDDIPF